MSNITKQIRTVTPSDDAAVGDFHYIQAGVAGDVAIQQGDGEVVIVKASLLAKMGIVPVGIFNKVLATGTTASDIYIW